MISEKLLFVKLIMKGLVVGKTLPDENLFHIWKMRLYRRVFRTLQVERLLCTEDLSVRRRPFCAKYFSVRKSCLYGRVFRTADRGDKLQ